MGEPQVQPPATPPGGPTREEHTLGMMCHLLALAGYFVPLGNILGPLIIWLVKREESGFVDVNGKESLNFQITITIIAIPIGVVGFLLTFVFIGFILLPLGLAAVGIYDLVMVIIAATRTNAGESYRYPFNFRLIK